MRVGELKTLLALAIGDEEAIREGCEWIRHFEQLNAQRRKVYRCIESLLNLDDAARYSDALKHLYGAKRCNRHKPCSTANSAFSACTHRGWRWKVVICTSACLKLMGSCTRYKLV